jgi:hypothetical protein
MNATSEERDPVVARVLAEIEVPDHLPGFWERLDAAMQPSEPVTEAVPEPAPVPAPAPAVSVFVDEPEPDPDPASTEITLAPPAPAEPAHRRWTRIGARVLAGAAALVVLVVAGVLVARDDGAYGPDLSEPTPTTTSIGPPATAPEPTAEEVVVVDFLDALGRGDLATAAALLGPRSEEYVTSQSGSVEAWLTEAEEGYGAWAASSDRTVRAVEGLPVVLVEGTVTVEGSTEFRRLAVPVVYAESAKAWFVDPWAFDPDVEDQRLEVGPAAPGEGLLVHTGQTGTASFALVEFDLPPASVEVGGDGTARWTVPDDAPVGTTLVVVFESASGRTVTATAIPVNRD